MGTGGLTTPSFPTPLNYRISIKKIQSGEGRGDGGSTGPDMMPPMSQVSRGYPKVPEGKMSNYNQNSGN